MIIDRLHSTGSQLVIDLSWHGAHPPGLKQERHQTWGASWLTEVADERGEIAARQARKVLSGVLGLAERRGAIASSVMHRVKTPGAKPGSAGDRKCTDDDCGKADVGDLAAFLFGTGVRISEAMHCVSWADVDLEARTARARHEVEGG